MKGLAEFIQPRRADVDDVVSNALRPQVGFLQKLRNFFTQWGTSIGFHGWLIISYLIIGKPGLAKYRTRYPYGIFIRHCLHRHDAFRRTQPYKSRYRFPRFAFDAAWRAAIDVLVSLYWRKRVRGEFFVRTTSVGGLATTIILHDGRVYTTTLRPHHTFGRQWYEGFLTASDADSVERDQLLHADGVLPEVLPDAFNLWPCQMKLSPSRFDKRGDNGSAWFGRLWVSAWDGRPGGEVYSIFADRVTEQGIVFKGHVLPYRRK